MLHAELLKRSVHGRFQAAGVGHFQVHPAGRAQQVVEAANGAVEIAYVLHDADEDQKVVRRFRRLYGEDGPIDHRDVVESPGGKGAARRRIGAQYVTEAALPQYVQELSEAAADFQDTRVARRDELTHQRSGLFEARLGCRRRPR